jgi:hypothetical protein
MLLPPRTCLCYNGKLQRFSACGPRTRSGACPEEEGEGLVYLTPAMAWQRLRATLEAAFALLRPCVEDEGAFAAEHA